MKTVLILILIALHLSSPGLAECPGVTEIQALRQRVKRAEAIELWAIRHGVHIDATGRVWR